MMMTTAAQEHERFTIERVYPNGIQQVWSAWASLERKQAWFGDGLQELDFRVGGAERGAFSDTMGEHRNETRYFEIKDRERIVLAYSMALNGTVHTVSLATIVFEDQGDRTRLTYTEQMCVIPPSDGVAGREHGWNALLNALERFLSQEPG